MTMSNKTRVDIAYTLFLFEKNLAQRKNFLQANNLEERQTDRVLKKRFFGPVGSLLFGDHWTPPPDLGLGVSEGRPYRYLDSRLTPWKRDIGDPIDYVDIRKRKSGPKKGLVTWETKEKTYSQSMEENYRCGRLDEFQVEIPSCMCGFSPKYHRAAPPAPRMNRTWSDPVFASSIDGRATR